MDMEPSGTQVVVHRAGAIVGRQPGQVKLRAELGSKLSTEPITLEVVGPIEAPERLRVEPDKVQVLAGETTPQFKVLVASTGDKQFRELDPAQAEFTISDSDVLESKSPGQFAAKKPGKRR